MRRDYDARHGSPRPHNPPMPAADDIAPREQSTREDVPGPTWLVKLEAKYGPDYSTWPPQVRRHVDSDLRRRHRRLKMLDRQLARLRQVLADRESQVLADRENGFSRTRPPEACHVASPRVHGGHLRLVRPRAAGSTVFRARPARRPQTSRGESPGEGDPPLTAHPRALRLVAPRATLTFAVLIAEQRGLEAHEVEEIEA